MAMMSQFTMKGTDTESRLSNRVRDKQCTVLPGEIRVVNRSAASDPGVKSGREVSMWWAMDVRVLEVINTVDMRKVEVLCVQETKQKSDQA